MRSFPIPAPSLVAAVAASMLCFAATGSAQEGVPPPPGLVPEQMWYAPTAADWQKPVAIRWQRTWDDAVRLSQQTKQPILVCVNMDGEIASEHYAGVRYRDPELAKLWEPYVCVIASVYRHNPRDHDDQGLRIPCPRLGNVTCGEHIAMEPIVFEKFLDGKRISPRHIMVELDGKEVFDVFYTWDTQSVFDTLRDGIQKREIQAKPVVKGDRSLREKLESPDSRDREELERLFADTDAEQRRAILQQALATGAIVPIELLRQAAFGLDPELAKQARTGMQKATDIGTIELIADTLKAPLAAEERKALAQSLRRFAGTSSRAQSLAAAHSGLAGSKPALDVERWRTALTGQTYAAAATSVDRAATAAASDRALAERPDDPAALLDVAESSLLQALDTTSAVGRGPGRAVRQQRALLLDDAERALQRAVRAGATGWRPEALAALLAHHGGQSAKAYGHAITAAPQLPAEAESRLAVELLALFAEARQQAIVVAVRQTQDWDPSWMSDVHTTYGLLQKHPLGTDQHSADHYDFLHYFGAPEVDAVLDRGLERFPLSPRLHERLRARRLEQGGPEALQQDYERRLAQPGAAPALPWFAGYAEMVAAEHHRRAQQDDAATRAYQRAIDRFARYRAATGNQDGEHFVAMSHGGIARLRLQAGDRAGTFAALQASFATNPAAAAATDGLGITTMQTAEMLRARCTEAKDEALLQQLEAALLALPSESFELPEYERPSSGQAGGRRPRRP